MKYCLTFFGTFILISAGAQQTRHEVKTGDYRCVYTTVDGRIEGDYCSYYANGKKRAEGKFNNHRRDGRWVVWDSLGHPSADRYYTHAVRIAENRPVDTTSKDALDRIYIKPHQVSLYNKPREEDIIWSKRVWRFIPKTLDNSRLLQNDVLGQCIVKAIRNGQLTAYSGSSDQFAVPFEGLNADTAGSIVGYRIKEDWYFDKTRSVMDVQIVALAPVVQVPGSKDSINLCWVYFPDLKPILARTEVYYCYQTTTMKEVFEHRRFKSEIYKESNVYDRALADYLPLKERSKEAERIEMEMIETEHELWMGSK